MLSRRSFVAGATALGTAALGCHWPAMQPLLSDPRGGPHARRLRLLVLGGTQYVGAAIVDEATRRGHHVTLFNRGLTNPHLFPSLERLLGDRFPDRGAGVASLSGKTWDGVIDVSGYFPRQVRATTELLESSGRYVFISTIAVYQDFSIVGLREDAGLRTMRNVDDERPINETYGARKALCERIVAERFPDAFTVLRMHAILGPLDPGDSLRYWAVRLARGGDVLAPGSGRDPVQFVDVRDVADLAVSAAEGQYKGIFNVIGPREPLTMRNLLDTCHDVVGSSARIHWVNESHLRSERIASWGDMPLWAPLSEDRGFTQIDATRARQVGFQPRSVAETVRGVLATTRLPVDYEFGRSGGITMAREQAVLRSWRGGSG